MKVVLRAALLLLAASLVTGDSATAQMSGVPALRSTVFPSDSARSRNPKSNQRSLVDTSTSVLAKLEMHESVLKPGASSHPPHRHGNEEVIYIQQGDVDVFQADVVRRAHPGDVVYMASNEWHNFTNVGTTDVKYLVVRFDTHDRPKDLPSTNPPAIPKMP